MGRQESCTALGVATHNKRKVTMTLRIVLMILLLSKERAIQLLRFMLERLKLGMLNHSRSWNACKTSSLR